MADSRSQRDVNRAPQDDILEDYDISSHQDYSVDHSQPNKKRKSRRESDQPESAEEAAERRRKRRARREQEKLQSEYNGSEHGGNQEESRAQEAEAEQGAKSRRKNAQRQEIESPRNDQELSGDEPDARGKIREQDLPKSHRKRKQNQEELENDSEVNGQPIEGNFVEDENNHQPEEEQKKKPEEKKEEVEFDPVEYEERIQQLKSELTINMHYNEKWLKKQLDKEGSAFDGTQGKCCNWLGNRRGAAIVHLFDRLFFIHFIRWPFAWLAKYNKKRFGSYAKVRYWTWILLTINFVASLLTFVILDCIPPNHGGHYYISIIYCLVGVFISVVDKHWTDVVIFSAKHERTKTKPIHWMSSDSEPQFAFHNNLDAKEVELARKQILERREREGNHLVEFKSVDDFILPQKESEKQQEPDLENHKENQDSDQVRPPRKKPAVVDLDRSSLQNLHSENDITTTKKLKKYRSRQTDLEASDSVLEDYNTPDEPPVKRKKSKRKSSSIRHQSLNDNKRDDRNNQLYNDQQDSQLEDYQHESEPQPEVKKKRKRPT